MAIIIFVLLIQPVLLPLAQFAGAFLIIEAFITFGSFIVGFISAF
jgi:hypothetical protein